jgi:putative membrane protein
MQVPASTLALLQAGAGGTWTDAWPAWLVAASRWGPLLLAALAALLVVRALLRRRLYRAEGVLNEAGAAAVRAAIAQAERGSRGELVVVVLERSDGHPDTAWLAGLCAMLLGTALLVARLPWQRPELVLAAQLALGAAGWLLARALPDVARLFLGERRATEMAHEQALQEFQRFGLSRTAGGTGVLLFVSLFEHRVVVLGDTAIHAKVGDAHWDATTRAVLQEVERGRLADGLRAGVEASGRVLAEHFPAAPGDRNELPDHLIVRRR